MKTDVEAVVAWMRTLTPERLQKEMKRLRRSSNRRVRRVANEAAVMLRALGKAEREACSFPRIQDFQARRIPYRDPGMKRGRGRVKFGDTPIGTPRWTPAAAVIAEDRYDLMSVASASACGDAPSITGRQFEHLRNRSLRIERRRLTERRPQQRFDDERLEVYQKARSA